MRADFGRLKNVAVGGAMMVMLYLEFFTLLGWMSRRLESPLLPGRRGFQGSLEFLCATEGGLPSQCLIAWYDDYN